MTVTEARAQYAAVARAMAAAAITHHNGLHPAEAWRCTSCHWLGGLIEAASLDYDLAVSEASQERTRASVAW